MEDDLTVYAANRDEWRKWLAKNHLSEKEVRLIYYKKGTGKDSVTYRESLEEAICYGWIDGIKKRIDEERYTHRFSPRKSKSKWSPLNLQIAEELIKNGKMTKAGIKTYEQRSYYPEELVRYSEVKEIELLPEFAKALRSNQMALNHFLNLALSSQKQFLGWLKAAKRSETLRNRIQEAIALLEKNETLGMK
ncbi:MAG: YdeI/OmpD-associated family protein [Saprospiraceae bacterium]|nr:YdeI/OmpD-associated family protein [Saprospiraceae bacterium]